MNRPEDQQGCVAGGEGQVQGLQRFVGTMQQAPP